MHFVGSLAFAAIGGWMLSDALRHPASAEPDQIWVALALVALFGSGAVLFGFGIVSERRRPHQGSSEAAGTGDGSLRATYSGAWTAIGLGGCIAFALAGLFLLTAGIRGGSAVMVAIGLLAAVVFGGFALIGVIRLLQSGWGRSIAVDAMGIRDSSLGNRLIAWEEVAAIVCRTFHGQRLIEVRLRDPHAYWSALGGPRRWLARLNAAFGFAPYSIGLTGLSVGEDEILAAIQRCKPLALPMLQL